MKNWYALEYTLNVGKGIRGITLYKRWWWLSGKETHLSLAKSGLFVQIVGVCC